MLPTAIYEWSRATPFVPFRIRMNSGRTFDVRHPEMIKVGMTHTTLYTFAGDFDGPYDRGEMIGNMLIESIAPIAADRPGPAATPAPA